MPNDYAYGSLTIADMQGWLGFSRSDGLIGPATIRTLQAHYGTVTDNILDKDSPTIAALQEEINQYL